MEKHNKKISVVGRREEEKYVGKTKTVARPEHYYVSFDWAISWPDKNRFFELECVSVLEFKTSLTAGKVQSFKHGHFPISSSQTLQPIDKAKLSLLLFLVREKYNFQSFGSVSAGGNAGLEFIDN